MTSLRHPRQLLSPRLLASVCTLAGALLWPPAQAAEVAPAPPPQSALDSALFYQLIVAEMSAQSGDNGSAFQLTLDAARKTSDAALFERAIEIALRSRAGESALQAAQAWAKAQPASREAARFQLQILIGLNKLPETVEVMRRSLSITPAKERPAAIGQLPRYFARLSDKKQAAAVLEQALTPELGSTTLGPAAWTAIGTLRLVAGDAAGAVAAAVKGAALNAASPEPVQLALTVMAPAYPQAEALIRKSLAANPQDEVRMAFVRKLLDADRLDEASTELTLLTRQSPKFADAWLVRGSLETQQKKWGDAERSLKRYLELHAPGDAAQNNAIQDGADRGEVQAYFMLSLVAEETGRLDEALRYLDKINNPQDRLRVQVRHANLLARQGKLEEARALVRAIPEAGPDDARTKLNAEVQLLRDAKDYMGAYELLGAAARRDTVDAELLYDYAMAAERVNRLDDMEKALRQAIALKPDHHHAYNALGYSLADRGIRLDEARTLVTKALSFAPDDPYIVDSLAWVEYRSGNRQEALRLLQQAFASKPDAEIAAHLGEVLWMTNQREQAHSVWKQGLELNPNNDTLLETMRRLMRQ